MLESRPAERPGIWDRDIETTPTAWKEAGVGMVVTYLTPLNPVPAPLVEETSIEPTPPSSGQLRDIKLHLKRLFGEIRAISPQWGFGV